MARSTPRRRADKKSRRSRSAAPPSEQAATEEPRTAVAVVPVDSPGPAPALVQPPPEEPPASRLAPRAWLTVWLLATLAGAGALAVGWLGGVVDGRIGAWLEVVPGNVPQVGAVVVATTYVWALAARTGGRPVVFGVLTAAVATLALVTDQDVLRNGAAAVVCALSAILAVVATVPAVRTLGAVREVLVALAVAALGGLATHGLQPTIDVARFSYLTLAMALVGCLVVVYRLGAGLHGLGRRGLFIVVFGSVVLVLTLAYGELLRRYGTPALVEAADVGVTWLSEHAGASPRPIVAVLGVPALMWGVHMRARRRQGWWVCAFGVVATAPVAQTLVQHTEALGQSWLALGYGVAVGLVLGTLLIRLDVATTGGKGSRGRRGRRAEEAAALRPEPPRIDALL